MWIVKGTAVGLVLFVFAFHWYLFHISPLRVFRGKAFEINWAVIQRLTIQNYAFWLILIVSLVIGLGLFKTFRRS